MRLIWDVNACNCTLSDEPGQSTSASLHILNFSDVKEAPRRKRPPDRRALCVRAVSAGQRCAYPTRNLLRVWKSLNVFSGTSKLVASKRCGLAPIQSASEIDS